MGACSMRLLIFIVGTLITLPTYADVFLANFRSEIGPLPKTAKQKLNHEADFRFNAKNWDEAILTGNSWLGSERRTSTGAAVIITGVELREAAGRGRGCV